MHMTMTMTMTMSVGWLVRYDRRIGYLSWLTHSIHHSTHSITHSHITKARENWNQKEEMDEEDGWVVWRWCVWMWWWFDYICIMWLIDRSWFGSIGFVFSSLLFSWFDLNDSIELNWTTWRKEGNGKERKEKNQMATPPPNQPTEREEKKREGKRDIIPCAGCMSIGQRTSAMASPH